MLARRYYQSTLTRKGQATIPIELREKLGLKEGDTLVWREVDGLVTVMSAREHVKRSAGMLNSLIDPSIASPSLEEMDDAIVSGTIDAFQKLESRN